MRFILPLVMFSASLFPTVSAGAQPQAESVELRWVTQGEGWVLELVEPTSVNRAAIVLTGLPDAANVHVFHEGSTEWDESHQFLTAEFELAEPTEVLQLLVVTDRASFSEYPNFRTPTVVSADIGVAASMARATLAVVGAYPNPFNPTTVVEFTIPSEGRVTVTVYNAIGQLVDTMVDGRDFQAGTYEITWDSRGPNVGAGLYLFRVHWESDISSWTGYTRAIRIP